MVEEEGKGCKSQRNGLHCEIVSSRNARDATHKTSPTWLDLKDRSVRGYIGEVGGRKEKMGNYVIVLYKIHKKFKMTVCLVW